MDCYFKNKLDMERIGGYMQNRVVCLILKVFMASGKIKAE